ncbi:dTDP-4-dehydrorhamnose 3,5-epimerase [Candidatus Uabimicrobium sp. HlEnr_7]|uniref:dTDP-4-dehydrorhamnose 3,5-epimerase n=1 Tax=Candidatus Uabimicrobium helgolandensis TaxID=3095367 RepID=UPI003557C7BC
MNFTIEELQLSGVLLIKSKAFHDKRGYFQEIFKDSVMEKIGLKFVQCNYSFSPKNVIRGLHYQQQPFSQGKMLIPLQGHIQDVVVDLRTKSPTFGQHLCVELQDLSAMLFIPEGFAHGFAVVSEHAAVMYMCTKEYQPSAECGIKFDDPDLNIPWKPQTPIVSSKDNSLPSWRELNF